MALPTPHVTHAVAALASEYLPRAHTEHACDETDPGLTLNVPAGQLWQLGADDAPRYVPYVPAAHWAHAVAPASDEAPNPHTVHGVEELASWSTVPAAHGVHAWAPKSAETVQRGWWVREYMAPCPGTGHTSKTRFGT